MNILLSTDNNYVMPTGVLMHSIGENNGSDVAYHVMTNAEFSDDSKAALTRVAERYGNTIAFYTITDEMTKALPFGRADQPTHVSIATYYRLFITEILPLDVHKIIYLDGDMIVRKSLKELWDTDLTGYAMGVVHDMDEQKHIQENWLPYDMCTYGYFNAGMLIINLDYWRKYDCYNTFMDFINNYANVIKYHDQDVLNSVFHDKKLLLSVTYNCQSGFLLKGREDGFFDKEVESDINASKGDAAIIHYCAPDKPWKIECFHPYCKDWRKYFFMSEWRHKRLRDEEENPSLKRRFRNWLVRHCWYVPATLYQEIPHKA